MPAEWWTDGHAHACVAGSQGYADRQPGPERADEESAEDDGAEARSRTEALARDDIVVDEILVGGVGQHIVKLVAEIVRHLVEHVHLRAKVFDEVPGGATVGDEGLGQGGVVMLNAVVVEVLDGLVGVVRQRLFL